jgi:hypothetical protein
MTRWTGKPLKITHGDFVMPFMSLHTNIKCGHVDSCLVITNDFDTMLFSYPLDCTQRHLFFMKATLTWITFLVAVAACSNTFVMGPAGEFAGTSPVPGYVLATLQDVQSEAFLRVYNALGVSVSSTASNPFPPSECPFVALQGGYLASGSPIAVTPTLIAPFSASGVLEVASLSAPVWMGVVDATSFNVNAEYVGPFNASFVDGLFVLSPSALGDVTLPCNPSFASVGLYHKAEFMVAPYGSDFPNPPSAGAVFVTLADMSSDVFVESFNINGLVASSNSASRVCCAMRIQGGYLSLSTSTLVPYTSRGSMQCPAKTLSAPVWLGTADNGAYPDTFVGPLNASSLRLLSVNANQPSTCTSGDVNVWALFKLHTTPSPPTPAPSSGDCYNMDIQVSYYLPDGTICIAERWTYYMKLGTVYQSIGMSSINECGGTVGTVDAYNMQLQPYNTSYMVGKTSGASSCDCTGITNWGFVPLNESGHGYKSTICYKSIQEFYFCEVLMWLNNGPVQCPP